MNKEATFDEKMKKYLCDLFNFFENEGYTVEEIYKIYGGIVWIK